MNRPQSPILILLVLSISMTLTGCATSYGCKGMPEDPTCLSTTEAYQVTDNALSNHADDRTEATKALATETKSNTLPRPTPYQPNRMPKIDDPTPIRTPAQVMRIWIAPWEDSDGDLMVSNYIYTELEPRRWMIGKAAPTLSPSLIPLQIEQRPAEKASTSELADKPLRSLPMNHLGNND